MGRGMKVMVVAGEAEADTAEEEVVSEVEAVSGAGFEGVEGVATEVDGENWLSGFERGVLG